MTPEWWPLGIAGHGIPAFGQFFTGVGFMVANLRRAKRLRPNESFADTYLPEKNEQALRRFGKIIFLFRFIFCIFRYSRLNTCFRSI